MLAVLSVGLGVERVGGVEMSSLVNFWNKDSGIRPGFIRSDSAIFVDIGRMETSRTSSDIEHYGGASSRRRHQDGSWYIDPISLHMLQVDYSLTATRVLYSGPVACCILSAINRRSRWRYCCTRRSHALPISAKDPLDEKNHRGRDPVATTRKRVVV
jgi:hypothetical protein